MIRRILLAVAALALVLLGLFVVAAGQKTWTRLPEMLTATPSCRDPGEDPRERPWIGMPEHDNQRRLADPVEPPQPHHGRGQLRRGGSGFARRAALRLLRGQPNRLKVGIGVGAVHGHDIRGGSLRRGGVPLPVAPIHGTDEPVAGRLILHVEVDEPLTDLDIHHQDSETLRAVQDPSRHGDLVVAVADRVIHPRDIHGVAFELE